MSSSRFTIALVLLVASGALVAHVETPTPTPPPTPGPVLGGETGSAGGGGGGPVARLAIAPERITLDGVAGLTQSPSAPAQVVIYDAPQNSSWSSSTTAAWLSVNPRSGKDDEKITVTADSSRLAPGTYTASILFHAASVPNSPLKFDVTLRIRTPEPSALRSSPGSLTLTALAESPDQPSARLTLQHQGEQILNWTATATTFNGGSWLTAAKANGVTPGDLIVSARLAGLLPGTYSGRITVASKEATNGSLQIPVTLNVQRRKTTLMPGSIVNVANFESGPIAPGQLLAIFGKGLGPSQGLAYEARNGKVPAELAGTTVTFDSTAAPILFASDEQLTVQAPYEIAGRPETRLKITTSTAETNEVTMRVVPVAPAVIKSGEKFAVYNSDGQIVDPGSPANAGSIARVVMIGLGVTNPPVETGDTVAESGPPETQPGFAASIRATLGGRPLKIVSAALVPGMVSVAQLSLEIPADAGDGSAPLEIFVGDAAVPAIPLATRAAVAATQPQQ